MTLTLYQFPISHYCEKVRWALDYKQLDYTLTNLLPGFHLRTIPKLAAKSSVPVLMVGDKAIQGSAAIIDWLDAEYPQRRLTPEDPELAQTAKAWEQWADGDLGVAVRCYLYHTVLDHPALAVKLLAHGGPFWGRPTLRLMFPALAKKMRGAMRINTASALRAQATIYAALERLEHAYREQPFLVGNQLTRADLTVAALTAPLFMPAAYGMPWPDRLPSPLDAELNDMRPQLQPLMEIYARYRLTTAD